jgi:hypothetical protein
LKSDLEKKFFGLLFNNYYFFSDFSIDFDKSTRVYYEILFNEHSEKSTVQSRANLNIFSLMNTIEKMLSKNKSFESLLEDWRCKFRLKIDFLLVNENPSNLALSNLEITNKGIKNTKTNFVLAWILRDREGLGHKVVELWRFCANLVFDL